MAIFISSVPGDSGGLIKLSWRDKMAGFCDDSLLANDCFSADLFDSLSADFRVVLESY